MPARKTTYQVKIREEGRGRPTVEAFTDLTSAAAFIRRYWQGAEYIDSNVSFHTDYATFELVGFSLNDIGTFSYPEGFPEYRFNDAGQRDDVPEDNGDYRSSYHVYY